MEQKDTNIRDVYDIIGDRDQFLAVSQSDLDKRGIKQLDFIIVSGDAYIDHHSFGATLIGRLLEANGYSVGIIAQPNWKDLDSYKALGTPKLGFLVTAGNMDSMVNHYSVSKRRRRYDNYSPDGEAGLRPDRATVTYSRGIREVYGKDVNIILGGIEASLRRFCHYDYWDDRLHPSILLNSMADILVYGMGERAILEIAEYLETGVDAADITFINGTVFSQDYEPYEGIEMASYDELRDQNNGKENFAKSFMTQYHHTESFGQPLSEKYSDCYVVQNPPQPTLSTAELDLLYDYPYQKLPHPMYEKGVPAIEEVRFSLTSVRGCFGGCTFCALTYHQGRIVQGRSHESLIKEAIEITEMPDFKGYIHDVGGPTANFRKEACDKQIGGCAKKRCLFPDACPDLDISHDDYLDLLRKLRELPKVKKVFVRSGIRYDYLIYDKDPTFFEELVQHHISGQLKVAPEHISPKVLEYMGKPHPSVYHKFVEEFERLDKKFNMNQFMVPYFISSHPGSTLNEAIELAEYLRDIKHTPEQVQDFYPTPGQMATTMYYTGLDPRTMEEVYVAREPKEKAMQRALMQYRYRENRYLVKEALEKAGREDLIGDHEKALIPKSDRQRPRSHIRAGKRRRR